MGVTLLVEIDLSEADLAIFDDYEEAVLALLADVGAKLLSRVRALDDQSETHLLSFPSRDQLDAFLAHPARDALQTDWHRSGATSKVTEVREIG